MKNLTKYIIIYYKKQFFVLKTWLSYKPSIINKPTTVLWGVTLYRLVDKCKLYAWNAVSVVRVLQTRRRRHSKASSSINCTFPHSIHQRSPTKLRSSAFLGLNTVPRSWSCRLVHLISYVTAVVTFTAYSAVIISFLAVQRLALPFHTFQGILDDGTYSFGLLNNSVSFNFFQVRKFLNLNQACTTFYAGRENSTRFGLRAGKKSFNTHYKERINTRAIIRITSPANLFYACCAINIYTL